MAALAIVSFPPMADLLTHFPVGQQIRVRVAQYCIRSRGPSPLPRWFLKRFSQSPPCPDVEVNPTAALRQADWRESICPLPTPTRHPTLFSSPPPTPSASMAMCGSPYCPGPGVRVWWRDRCLDGKHTRRSPYPRASSPSIKCSNCISNGFHHWLQRNPLEDR